MPRSKEKEKETPTCSRISYSVVAKSAIVSQQGESKGYSRRLLGTILKQMRERLTAWFLLTLHPPSLSPSSCQGQDRWRCSHHPVTRATLRVGAKTKMAIHKERGSWASLRPGSPAPALDGCLLTSLHQGKIISVFSHLGRGVSTQQLLLEAHLEPTASHRRGSDRCPSPSLANPLVLFAFPESTIQAC